MTRLTQLGHQPPSIDALRKVHFAEREMCWFRRVNPTLRSGDPSKMDYFDGDAREQFI